MINTYLNGNKIVSVCGCLAFFKDVTFVNSIFIPDSAFKKTVPKRSKMKKNITTPASKKTANPKNKKVEISKSIKENIDSSDFSKYMDFSGVKSIK